MRDCVRLFIIIIFFTLNHRNLLRTKIPVGGYKYCTLVDRKQCFEAFKIYIFLPYILVCMYVCMYVCIYIYTHTHIYIYIYICCLIKANILIFAAARICVRTCQHDKSTFRILTTYRPEILWQRTNPINMGWFAGRKLKITRSDIPNRQYYCTIFTVQ